MAQSKEDKLWSMFEDSGNSEPELVEKAKALAQILLAYSARTKGTLFDTLKQKKDIIIDTEKEDTVLFEFLFLFMHLADRMSFTHLDSYKRKVFTDSLVLELGEVLSKLEESGVESALFRKTFIATYNDRQIEYGKYTKLFPEKDEGAKDTLFGEFGKKIASICGYKYDLVVVGSAQLIGATYFGALQLSELFEGYLNDSEKEDWEAFQWVSKDYYKILGVDNTASHNEIKKAYRRAAKKYHPDKNHGSKGATARFIEATEAYEILGNTEKRRLYDEAREYLFSETQSDAYIVITCPGCERKLRVPDGKFLRVTCPDCNMSFDHPPAVEATQYSHHPETRYQENRKATQTSYASSHEPKMPTLLSIIGGLAIAFGSLQLVILIAALLSGSSSAEVRASILFETIVIATALGVWIYVFKRRAWARTGVIIIYSLSIAISILLVFEGNSQERIEGYFGIILYSLLLAYLSTKGVKNYFGLYEEIEATFKPEATIKTEASKPGEVIKKCLYCDKPVDLTNAIESCYLTCPYEGCHKTLFFDKEAGILRKEVIRSSSGKGSIVFTILGLVFIFPLGLHLMWSKKHFPLWARITISACIGVMLITFMTVHMTVRILQAPKTAHNLQREPIEIERNTVLYSAKAPPLIQDKQEIFSTAGNLTAAQISGMYGPAVVSVIKQGMYGTISGVGSGFVIEETGVIVTNYHCVEGAHTLSVKFLRDDFPLLAKVIATDKDSDIAILKTDRYSPVAVTLGNSDTIAIGEEIVVIGTPQGLEYTVSDGIISSIREGHILQITAPISKGSSGSPVFNMHGQVIGIVFSLMETGQNLNFAVPVNHIKELLPTQTVNVRYPPEVAEEAETVFKELPQLNTTPKTSTTSTPLKLDPNKFYAPKDSRIFHKLSCPSLNKSVPLQNFISFKEAVESGGKVCRECFPGFVQ